MRITKFILIFCVLISFSYADLQGQLSTVGDLRKISDSYVSQFGLRYIPTWSFVVPWPTAIFDTEVSLDINASYVQPHNGNKTSDLDLKPYRFWFRRSTDKLEVRAGLQKITFGSAKIFRSLMWFDRLDPTDPLQITEGVWGIRARRDFLNNSNIWLWGLLWNNDTKGWDLFPTKKNNVELGGRYQLPISGGEIGFSAHNRIIGKSDVSEYFNINSMSNSTPEWRGAIDGYFDLGVGLWFESTIIHSDYGEDFFNWQSFLTIGSDYTFGIGNGITITGEHFIYNMDDEPLATKDALNMSGLMFTYPLGLFDILSSFVLYSWEAELARFYLSWQRSYDDWIFVLNVFFSSDAESSFSFGQGISNFSSRGLQLMLIYNH
jgi:hypothetical protein